MINKWLIRVNNAEIIQEGYSEYVAIVSTGLFTDVDMIECLNPELGIWLYKVWVAGRYSLLVVSRIKRSEQDGQTE